MDFGIVGWVVFFALSRHKSSIDMELDAACLCVWFKEFIDHRDPHLLGPPLRPDPQSYTALERLLVLTKTYSVLAYSSLRHYLSHGPYARPALEAVPRYLFLRRGDLLRFPRPYLPAFVGRFVTSVPRVGSDVFNADVISSLVLE